MSSIPQSIMVGEVSQLDFEAILGHVQSPGHEEAPGDFRLTHFLGEFMISSLQKDRGRGVGGMWKSRGHIGSP